MTISVEMNHLDFYRQHNIIPVRYDLSSTRAHLQKRQSLYHQLGVPLIAFKSSKVLEIAAGTGQNSLYIAQAMPNKLVLLEPNVKAIEYIHDAYEDFSLKHTKPIIIQSKLEDYNPDETFDIVICENWLGTSSHEKRLLKKLPELLSSKGILVITAVSPVGFVPNLLRRYLSTYIAPVTMSFEQRTALLSDAFSPHLKTISYMSRNITDWIQDNMINPAYFGLCLSIPEIIDTIGSDFDVLSSSPTIAEDWRWFKELYGENRAFNTHYLEEYYNNAHNFLDYLEPTFRRDMSLNYALEEVSLKLLELINQHEVSQIHGADSYYIKKEIERCLNEFILKMPDDFKKPSRALRELHDLLVSGFQIKTKTVSNLKYFSRLFGRETSYISMQKR